MSTLTVTRVTHSCVLLDFAGIKILTDPWFSERPATCVMSRWPIRPSLSRIWMVSW
jgi:L-ascorbate metabolism protein UlaG (beta-lactamase superfamily)